VITTALAVEWATLPQGTTTQWWAHRLSYVRGFARYAHSLDLRHEVPPTDVIPVSSHRKPVYLYSEADVMALMAAAEELKEPLRALTYSTLIGLVAVTGMRVGEAIALDRSDVDGDEAVLTIRHSKFGKSREVVVHPTTVDALRRYDRKRRGEFPRTACPAFFLSLRGKRLIYQNVHRTFFRLVDRAGLSDREPRRPRIHDLRHSFASRTLSEWYREGVDVERRLPLLSTYLGHVDPSTTYWYLSSAPELMGLAGKRLEVRLGELP
jgi:integrase